MADRYWSGNMTGSSPNWNYTTGGTNWGSASGVADDVSVPASGDTVYFDGAGTNGNTNSTISATITISGLVITSGYTATMTHNAVLSLNGTVWTMHSGYTIAGSSSITITGAITMTITSGGQTWPNGLTCTGGNKTLTLVGNFIVGGTLSTAINSHVNINKTTTETFTCNGLTLLVNGYVSGNAGVILAGGTWTSGVSSGDIRTNLTFAGNVTVSGVVYMGSSGNTVTYSSGTITTTGSQFVCSNSTLNTAGITWNIVLCPGANVTATLTSNLTCATLVITGANNKFNATTSEKVLTTNLTMTSGSLVGGSAVISLTGGGTWSGSSNVGTHLEFDGDTTVSGYVSFGEAGYTLSHTSGTITTTGSTLFLAATCTLDTDPVSWNNVTTTNTLAQTYTINSLLTVAGTLTIGTGSSTTFAGTHGFITPTLVCDATGATTITLQVSVTYTITSSFLCNKSRVGAIVLFVSSSLTVKTNILLPNNGSNLCNVLASFTRVDASSGRSITTFGGTITDCTNVIQYYDYPTIAA